MDSMTHSVRVAAKKSPDANVALSSGRAVERIEHMKVRTGVTTGCRKSLAGKRSIASLRNIKVSSPGIDFRD